MTLCMHVILIRSAVCLMRHCCLSYEAQRVRRGWCSGYLCSSRHSYILLSIFSAVVFINHCGERSVSMAGSICEFYGCIAFQLFWCSEFIFSGLWRKGFPTEQLTSWIQRVSEKIPFAVSLARYWSLKAYLAALGSGGKTAAMQVLEEAHAHNATVSSIRHT